MATVDPEAWARHGLARTGEPLRLNGLVVPHRVLLGSMHTGLEVRDDGGAALGRFYRERIEGGAGLIISGGLAVNAEGRGGPDYAVLSRPDDLARLGHAVAEVHEAGGLILAQLFHAGRYALPPEGAVAPSPVAWRAASGALPREFSAAEVRATIDDFAAAAVEACRAGFDGVEIMASEGYLVNQFCSPLTNLRNDEWGGDPERRRRFALETLLAVRAAIPAAVPVTVRVSGDDLMPGSSTRHEADLLVAALVEAGADAISVGVGWHESSVPTVQAVVPHGAWIPVAEHVARAVRRSSRPGVPVIASNRVTDLRDVEAVLGGGLIDAVALARPFLADPAIIQRSLTGAFDSVMTCIGCNQACIDRSLVSLPVSCLVNPRAGNETRYPVTLTRRARRIAVVGAGPAGLAAALDAARRGHEVRLFEAADRLGGQFDLAARVPGKEDYAGFVRSAAVELAALDADVRIRSRPTPSDLADFDGVLLAVGVRPRPIDLPGAHLPHVLPYDLALREGVRPGRVVILGGGGIGLDVATFLVESSRETDRAQAFADAHGIETTGVLGGAARNHPPAPPRHVRPGSEVTVLRRGRGRFGEGVGISTRWVTMGALRRAGVVMRNGLRYRSITPDGVHVTDAEGTDSLLPAEHVIVCAGQVSETGLARSLDLAGIPYETVGGARDAAGVDAVRATAEGIEAARRVAP